MSEDLPGPVVCIAGPTASGKSSLADAVAMELGSVVVSVDAMQVYRGMDVGTAKTPPAERPVPLLMVDVADIEEDYSVVRYQRDARICVDDVLGRGLTPVLCGGTGLYLDAVIDEMDFPAGEARSVRREAYERYEAEHGVRGLYELLRQRDPASARLLHPNNARRVERALEMLDDGTSYTEQNARLKTRPRHYDARVWALTMDRAKLYARINRRVDAMFERGLVDEVRGLCARGLADSITSRQAIGYKEVIEALRGESSLDEARERIKTRSRRYAKRQLSWLRRDGRVRWLDLDRMDMSEAKERILGDLTEGSGLRG